MSFLFGGGGEGGRGMRLRLESVCCAICVIHVLRVRVSLYGWLKWPVGVGFAQFVSGKSFSCWVLKAHKK